MSSSEHNIKIKATDQTRGAFSSIAKSAGSLNGMLGGALGALGAYLSLRTVKAGLDELGHLSDIAMKTGQSADDLTRFATAFDVLGIQNMGIDQLGKAFDYMMKTTGRTGKEGFLATIQELAAIPDVAERGQAAMKTFGRTGMELMPIINAAAANGIDALQTVVDAMPGVANAAANQGDAVADAMTVASTGVKRIWLNALGTIAGYFSEIFGFGIVGAASAGIAYLEYASKMAVISVKTAWMQITQFTSSFGAGIGGFFGTLFNGGSLEDALNGGVEALDNQYREKDDELKAYREESQSRADAWQKTLQDRIAAARALDEATSKAAVSGNSDKAKAANLAKEPAIKNALIAAGTNAAMKLAMGASESKQIELLRQIANNTKSTAANTEGGEEWGVID